MARKLVKKSVLASFACVAALSACQPRQSGGIETSEVESATAEEQAVGFSQMVDAKPTAPSTTSGPTLTESSTAEEATATPTTVTAATTVDPTTTLAESTTTSNAVVTTTTSVLESTTTTIPSPTSVLPPPTTPGNYSIDISGFSFSPSALTVRVGDTVTWTNLDSAIHTVTFSGSASISSSGLQDGDTHSVTFDSVGTYAYGCSPHPSMQGTITVTE